MKYELKWERLNNSGDTIYSVIDEDGKKVATLIVESTGLNFPQVFDNHNKWLEIQSELNRLQSIITRRA